MWAILRRNKKIFKNYMEKLKEGQDPEQEKRYYQ